ncbi:hypothetical protein GYMLUDRAFT_68276 [Collybiopsis luxurians FD-317 M1]|nr:hypothetical protein GYMLUDRAFT_68276 [Collybiopsis luxurians FD-317 M1]
MEHLLEELQLISCSLLPGEFLTFLEQCEGWKDALQTYGDSGFHASWAADLPPPSFQIGIEDHNLWFEAALSSSAGPRTQTENSMNISVKGEDISRSQHQKWQDIVKSKLEEIGDSEFPMYQLLSLYLLPMLHEEADSRKAKASEAVSSELISDSKSVSSSDALHHALFTSHHLVSPTKRRNLQQWSSSLFISGFAKVGYPGVIYAEGMRQNVEEFVDNVKAMQWLALKLRFMEPVPEDQGSGYGSSKERWKEYQKVGEVTEEMRKIGREKYVVEMGIGSAGTLKG